MASSIGHSVRLSIFGQSHSEAIGCVVEGLPAGISVDLDELQAFLARRAPGRSDTSTACTAIPANRHTISSKTVRRLKTFIFCIVRFLLLPSLAVCAFIHRVKLTFPA